mmetsp:Transcript_10889/g.29875  ORF Transcript_10889/g.29875 Transcript_10889/m.29875 type:complete len:206 (-) Transcript_10889:1043-1660(-)|eukprot:CAMPEP_0202355712 /NCGR_PEP_ID=MMETSP1126-20121109/10488_1 /ASSEMBLY_ACC=CAM_ASM_000457 /TAXON_ID=3047 /ORGANISM="Dunaliella tertiolecta, Strain CCMP1320" /LENGTH=205 /DNA_ID=CAMNT_0048948365 /DNA_START=213 /DNA_END=830 /DNA_ORIENTATION=-
MAEGKRAESISAGLGGSASPARPPKAESLGLHNLLGGATSLSFASPSQPWKLSPPPTPPLPPSAGPLNTNGGLLLPEVAHNLLPLLLLPCAFPRSACCGTAADVDGNDDGCGGAAGPGDGGAAEWKVGGVSSSIAARACSSSSLLPFTVLACIAARAWSSSSLLLYADSRRRWKAGFGCGGISLQLLLPSACSADDPTTARACSK